MSTEITRLPIPASPGEPKFTNTSNYVYVPAEAFSYSFTVLEVVNPATDVKIKKVQDTANVYNPYRTITDDDTVGIPIVY